MHHTCSQVARALGQPASEEVLRLGQGVERRQDRRQVTDTIHHLLRRDTCELSRRRPAGDGQIMSQL